MASFEDEDTVVQGESAGQRLARMGTDAQLWAEEFMKQHGHAAAGINEHLMLSWFASAIETGRSAGREEMDATLRKNNEELMDYIRQLEDSTPADPANMTWSPASEAKIESIVVPAHPHEAWETLVIEVPKPEDFPNDQWFHFKASAMTSIADLITACKLWEPRIESMLEVTKARLKAFRDEALKDPKIAKNICKVCGLDKFNEVHRVSVVKGYHEFESMVEADQ